MNHEKWKQILRARENSRHNKFCIFFFGRLETLLLDHWDASFMQLRILQSADLNSRASGRETLDEVIEHSARPSQVQILNF